MEQCVYCNIEPGISADHVPPKAFFPRARRNNLLTVPSCIKCNNALSKDEEYVLASLMFSDAGVSLVGKELWEERVSRMFEKNRGLRRRFARDFHQVELRTPAGIFLERRIGFDYDAPRFRRVVGKIVRGLYFAESAIAYQLAVQSLPCSCTRQASFKLQLACLSSYSSAVVFGQRPSNTNSDA